MNTVVGLDVISTAAFLLAFFFVLRLPGRVLDHSSRSFVYLFLGVYIFVGVSNVLEHGGISAYPDRYEDYTENLFAPFFLFFIYSLLTKSEMDKRKKVERDLRIKNSAIESTIGGIALFDLKGNITYVNRALLRLWGYRDENEMVGGDYAGLFHDEEGAVENFVELLGKGSWVGEVSARKKSGFPFDVYVIGSVVKGDDGSPISVFASFIDITERKLMEEKLRAISVTDDLTGLSNRRGFFAFADKALRQSDRSGRGLVLVFADLDDLKGINDTHGHLEGDRALRDVSDLLRENFRHSDIVARIGGDEFVVLLVDFQYPDVVNHALARLHEKLEGLNRSGKNRYRLSISTGIVHYDPQSPCSLDELLGRADRLMYEAKQRKP